ncbi:MAG TPA: DUF2188 domain-containing protein [Allosphingosinicella sp.]
MVGRNFWVAAQGDGWEVRQEGLPDKTTRHSSREEAWDVANERARDCHGEAFLDDGQGGAADHVSHRALPRKIK